MNLGSLVGPAVIAAAMGALVTVVGWFVSNRLKQRAEDESRREDAALRHLQDQIENLYGPMLGLIEQLQVVYDVAAVVLPTDGSKHIDFARFSPKDGETWDYFTETYFIPLNSEVASLLRRKSYLMESGMLPASFRDFLAHQAHLECRHRLWKERRIDSAFAPGPSWPKQFNEDVKAALARLKNAYDAYAKRRSNLE